MRGTRRERLCFEAPEGGGTDVDLAEQSRERDGVAPWWRCAACGYRITPHAAAMAMHGCHEHYCRNPLGIDFHIGCFREAPGCRNEGEATLDHTWFAGHAWRYALCAGCHTHLGWFFRARAGDGFYALILPRLSLDAGSPTGH